MRGSRKREESMLLTERLNAVGEPHWQRLLAHPFLKELGQGKLPQEKFDFWAQQDYIFVREAQRFFSVLIAKSPADLQSALLQVFPVLQNELQMFRDYAKERGFDIETIEPAPVCHAYISFLLSTAYSEDYLGAFTVLYGAEKAYLDSWLEVKKQLVPTSPYQRFVGNWTKKEFQDYVAWLGDTLNNLAKGYPADYLSHVEWLYIQTGRYEYQFWEMCNQESARE